MMQVDVISAGGIPIEVPSTAPSDPQDLKGVELQFRELAMKYARPYLMEALWNPTHHIVDRSAHYVHRTPPSEQGHAALGFFVGAEPVSRLTSVLLEAMVGLMNRWGLWAHCFPAPLTHELRPFAVGHNVGIELVVAGDLVPAAAEVKVVEGFAKFYVSPYAAPNLRTTCGPSPPSSCAMRSPSSLSAPPSRSSISWLR